VKRDAQIGMAEPQRDADIRSSEARQVGETAKIMADVGIAQAERDKKIKVAQFDAQAESEQAQLEKAGLGDGARYKAAGEGEAASIRTPRQFVAFNEQVKAVTGVDLTKLPQDKPGTPGAETKAAPAE